MGVAEGGLDGTKDVTGAGMLVHTFNASAWEVEEDTSLEFDVSLVYIASPGHQGLHRKMPC